jgi:hypothetical protein
VAYGLWKGEVRNRRKNGELYVEWLTITAVRDPESSATHYVGTFFDIPSARRPKSGCVISLSSTR